MHWLRIDRYYSSDVSFQDDNQNKDDINGLSDSLSVFGQMEDPNENPQVVFQPVMCQHCNQAPCEQFVQWQLHLTEDRGKTIWLIIDA